MKLKELLNKLQETQKKIGASPAYICGGSVRDRYMGHLEKISDIDITTGDKTVDYLSQEYAIALKKQFNIQRKTAPDGHSTIYIGNLKLDFSSNFTVPNIDSILLKSGIKNPTNMQKEIFSRDFTCNALLLSLDLKNVIDPTHQGFKDIDNKIIKTCLAPQITLTNSKNRVARAIYLAAKLDFEIDSKIISFVKAHPDSIKISTEKSLHEKISEAFKWNPQKSAYYIKEMGLWNYIPVTPEIYPYYKKSLV